MIGVISQIDIIVKLLIVIIRAVELNENQFRILGSADFLEHRFVVEHRCGRCSVRVAGKSVLIIRIAGGIVIVGFAGADNHDVERILILHIIALQSHAVVIRITEKEILQQINTDADAKQQRSDLQRSEQINLCFTVFFILLHILPQNCI